MKLVVLESPFRGATPEQAAANKEYLQSCIKHSLSLGEAPYASHQMFTCALNDDLPTERALGMAAGQAWYAAAEACVVYVDRGISGGMKAGIERSQGLGIPIEYRTLPEDSPK